MQVTKNNMTQYLTATNTCFMIPVYQRNYDWTEENCKQLWQDIWYISQNPQKTHFLGTICSKSNGHERTIIDGQQRITTITLLMKAMHDYVDNEDFKHDIDSNFLHNTGYGVSENHRVKLHLNKRDDAAYNALLIMDSVEDAAGDNDEESRIISTYRYFRKRLDGLSEDNIMAVRGALDRLVVVDLDVEQENPQEIFESLNSTGLDLSDVDLLRNYLLMNLDYSTQVRLYNDYWYKIEQNVRPENMGRFFVDYLIYVKKSDAIMIHGSRGHANESNLYQAFREYYSDLGGEARGNSSTVTEQLLADMHECSQSYKELVFDNGVDMNQLNPIKRTIYSIVNLNQSVTSRPILLYIMMRYHNGSIDEQACSAMLNACLSLVFRAKVTHGAGINSQFAGNVLQKLPDEVESDIVDKFWRAITSGSGKFAFPSDEVFQDALLNRPVFDVLRARGTKYLLYTLEQHSPAAKGLPRYNDPNITIEHIMPKTLSDAWNQELGRDALYHDDYLNKLGNLTLTSNNAEMSNDSFMKKKEWYSESSFSLTRSLVSSKRWTIENIRARGEELARTCLRVWSFPAKYQAAARPAYMSVDSKTRRASFKFSMIGLGVGDVISYIDDPSKTMTIISDNRVSYQGRSYSLTSLAQKFSGKDHGVSGPRSFCYEGETLDDLRTEAENGML